MEMAQNKKQDNPIVLFEGEKYYRPEHLFEAGIARTSKDLSVLISKKGFPAGFRLGPTKVYKAKDITAWLKKRNGEG